MGTAGLQHSKAESECLVLLCDRDMGHHVSLPEAACLAVKPHSSTTHCENASCAALSAALWSFQPGIYSCRAAAVAHFDIALCSLQPTRQNFLLKQQLHTLLLHPQGQLPPDSASLDTSAPCSRQAGVLEPQRSSLDS